MKLFFFFIFVQTAPQSPKKRGPRLSLRKKSLSCDSPDCGYDGNVPTGNVRQNIPKVVESYCSKSGENNNYNSPPASNRPPTYGTWVNIVRSRMVSQIQNRDRNGRTPEQTNKHGSREIPTMYMEFSGTSSAPSSYNHCMLFSCFTVNHYRQILCIFVQIH